MVWDMCQLERWRVMVQEKAADQLYQPIPTRSKSPATSAADKPIGARRPIVGTPEHLVEERLNDAEMGCASAAAAQLRAALSAGWRPRYP